jgi:hypothetical protein
LRSEKVDPKFSNKFSFSNTSYIRKDRKV